MGIEIIINGELGAEMAVKINKLAALFYSMGVTGFSPDIDFRNSSNTDEKLCWNMSIGAHAFITGDPVLLKYQSD